MENIAPSPEQIQAFMEQVDDDSPIVMINLLKYRNQAHYPAGTNFEPCTGEEAYQRYGAGAGPIIESLGARLLWMGSVKCVVIGPLSESWDDALLVQYPSRKTFFDMVSMSDYQAAAVHRTAALEDSRLIATITLADQF